MLIARMKLSIIHEQRRFPSPAATPQALAWEAKRALLWMGSRDLRRIYAIDPADWKVVQETEAPGIPWAAVSTNGSSRFTIGEGMNDDRYIRSFAPNAGFSDTERIACAFQQKLPASDTTALQTISLKARMTRSR